MWVRVDHCGDQKQLVFGMLDNEPLNENCGKVKLGSARFDHQVNTCVHMLTDFELFVLPRKKMSLGFLSRWKYLDVSEL
jgi:hypothetical protein